MTMTTPDYKTDSYFDLEDHWISTASNELTHYHDNGEGEPLLMLHGSGFGTSAASTWWLNIPQLSQITRTIAFDFIGYGETVCAPDTHYGIRQWGAHTLRLMDALNIDKAWLVGSSLGGWVALQLALDFPERILGVVSIGTGGAQRETLSSSTANYNVKPKPSLPQAFNKSIIRRDLQKNIMNDALISERLVNLRYDAASKEVENGLRPSLLAARDRDREDLPLDLEALGHLSLPVLLIHGFKDKVVPLSRSMQLLQSTPTADAHIYSQCGHWPHITKSDEFNKLVCDYIHSHSASH